MVIGDPNCPRPIASMPSTLLFRRFTCLVWDGRKQLSSNLYSCSSPHRWLLSSIESLHYNAPRGFHLLRKMFFLQSCILQVIRYSGKSVSRATVTAANNVQGVCFFTAAVAGTPIYVMEGIKCCFVTNIVCFIVTPHIVGVRLL